MNLRPPGYETSRSRSATVRLTCLSHPECPEVMLGLAQMGTKWVKILVSSDNANVGIAFIPSARRNFGEVLIDAVNRNPSDRFSRSCARRI